LIHGLPSGCATDWQERLGEDRAAQLVEFAVALPLLVVFVVGIFDFSGAFTLKQRLTNIARDASRTAAVDPSNDVQPGLLPPPASVVDVFQIVDNYLLANNVNDCGITVSNVSAAGLTWTFNANGNGCPSAGLTIIVNRGYYFPATGAVLPGANCQAQSPNAQTAIVATCVSVQYPYPWRFGKAASLLGSNNALPTTITAVAVAMNED